MSELYETWGGLIPLLCGIYGLLIAFRIIPITRQESEKTELWHRKFGTLMKILSPLIILLGILQLCGVLR